MEINKLSVGPAIKRVTKVIFSGILSPYLSHIVADLTIGYYLVCKA
jgi:hypothetical protein